MRPADNPFSTTRVHGLQYRFGTGNDMQLLLQKLAANSYRGALVGEKGNGKTTLMLELSEPLKKLNFKVIKLFLNQEKKKLTGREFRKLRKELTSHHIILLDGAEQMTWVRWQLFKWHTRKAKGLIITVHTQSKLPTLLECQTSLNQFIGMVQDLTSDLKSFDYTDKQLEALWKEHDGNTRLAFRKLYDFMGST